jgi:hypothetical protein
MNNILPTCCSCGDAKPHKVAERRTMDGATVVFWSDGLVTGRMGVGLIQAGAHSTWGAFVRRTTSEALRDEVCLFDWLELPKLFERGRDIADKILNRAPDMDGVHTYVRRYAAEMVGVP